jgi:hypothetical protein
MSMKDKLEIGLKPDAPYRPDNLPEFQQTDADCQQAAEPGDGPAQQAARDACTDQTGATGRRKGTKRTDGVPKE